MTDEEIALDELSNDDYYETAPRIKSLQVVDKEGKDLGVHYRGRLSDIAQATLHHLGKPLRLNNHKFMMPVYNSGDRRIVLKCSRQVAKTVDLDTRISLANGATKRAGDIQVGDRVATMAADGCTMLTGTVTWVSDVFRKPCVRIHSRQGHSVDVALTHPMRVWDDWKRAGLVEPGDRLAVVRRAGDFDNASDVPLERIRLTAYLIGDGYIDKDISFTSVPGVTLDEFLADLVAVGGSASISSKAGSRAVSARLRRQGPIHGWMKEDGLHGSRSGTKRFPEWVFTLQRQDAALFLNRLWSTDGHVKRHGSRYAVGYASISNGLIVDVQKLLWKFGIPSKIRSWVPKVYRGTKKRAYSLRIETERGATRFLSEIGCLGKSDQVERHTRRGNNNRDTYPTGIQQLIHKIVESRGNSARLGCKAEHSLRSAGLQERLVYPPTAQKVSAYVEHFRADERYDQSIVDVLEAHLRTDLFWDCVMSTEDIGSKDCIDFEVEGTHSFVANGFVTHNSTTIANIQVTESMLRSHWRSLYVSPSALQTRQYSNEKLRPTIYESPFVHAKFVGKYLIDQVFEKTLSNGSYLFLRYAFLTAARARGIPASRVFFDEVQDLLKENIKVIAESVSASKLAMGVAGTELLAGTPLTFSNTLEEYWKWSTQCEWLVPCDCKKPKFWNLLGVDNIGKNSLVCANCDKAINPAAGQWVSFEPNQNYHGYHVTQLMVPWKQDPETWREEIVFKFEKWPSSSFYNEVLGLAFDSASAPVTRMDIERCSWPRKKFNTIDSSRWYTQSEPSIRGMQLFAGIDWGEGREEGDTYHGKRRNASFTILTIGGYISPGLFWPIFMKKYRGREIDPEFILPDILNWCGVFNVFAIGADWGHGWGMNQRLMKAVGKENFMQFYYSSALKERKKWDKEGFKWIVNRNAVLSDFFLAIKNEQLLLPPWEVFEDFGKDILAEYVEFNDRKRTMLYDHPIDQPDDALHSIIYARLTADIMLGRF